MMKKFTLFSFISLFCLLHPLRADHLSGSLMFSAWMTGDQEVPSVTTNAEGVAMFSLDYAQRILYVNISVTQLSGPIMGAHIHEGAAGTNGGVVIDLTEYISGNRIKGAIRDIDKSIIGKLLTAQYYINVHTAANPGGEIRGQIELETDHRFSAFLTGDQEVPQVITDAFGVGVFQLNHARTKIDFEILFQGLSSPVTGAHIHNAAIGMNGSVIQDLEPFLQGNTISGSWEPGDFLASLLAGELYINIHTVNNPGGEIRGQLDLLQGITFDSRMDGSQENPAVTTPATGLGVITVAPDLGSVEYIIVFDSLTAAPTAAHFHMAVAGMNGGVVINISDHISGNTIIGSMPMTDDLLLALLRGELYVNIHTSTHPGGEIRGQVYRFAREPYTFDINGGQEVPSVTTSASGAGLVTIDRDQRSAHFMVVVDGLEGSFSASHFHQGKAGVNGGVIFNLTDYFDPFGGAFGYWDETNITPFDASPLFRAHEVYINVHSDLHPGGEVRGNIIRSRELFGELPFDPGFGDDIMLYALLTGDESVPPVTTDAFGLATVYFNEDRTSANVNITATNLSGPITGIHIHEGDFGTNGGVLYPLSNVGNRVQTEITDINSLDIISLLNGGTYVNIHTEANPDGEIRGQLGLDQDFLLISFLNGDNEVPAVTTNGTGLASFQYTQGTLFLDMKVQLSNLSSEITGVHLHTGQPDANGPVAIDLMEFLDGNVLHGRVGITLDNLISLASGSMYINVHTIDHPEGEIRGQIGILPGVTFDGWMSGVQEVPFTNSAASGLAVATIFPGVQDIAVWMVTDNTSGPVTATHLHQAPMFSNGGVQVDLTSSLVNNSLIHLDLVEEGLLGALLRGEIYINAHTAAYPGGELRGQLFRLARDPYGFDLCPEQEVGLTGDPVGTGTGRLSIDRLHSNLHIFAVADGLSGNITSTHIHEAPVGVNGGVIIDLTDFIAGNGFAISGGFVDTAVINSIRAGNTYLNMHTAANPAGEIRGQIVKDFLCSIEVGVDPLGDYLADVQLYPVPVTDELHIALDVLQAGRYQVDIIDLSGRRLSSNQSDLETGRQEVRFDTQRFLAGMYMVQLTHGSLTQSFKFVK